MIEYIKYLYEWSIFCFSPFGYEGYSFKEKLRMFSYNFIYKNKWPMSYMQYEERLVWINAARIVRARCTKSVSNKKHIEAIKYHLNQLDT